jgi:NADH dehydrogenase FAD-containing subunit
MARHLVLVGGGHAHLTVLARLGEFVRRGHRVTLVGPAPWHYYSGMGPGLLAATYRPAEIRFNIRRMVHDRGGEFVCGAVASIDPGQRLLHLSGGEKIPYDVASFNTGSEVPLAALGGEGPGIVAVKPIDNLFRVQQRIRADLQNRSLRLLVVGGGPAGVEIAGNLCRLLADSGGEADITLLAGDRLLPALPPQVRELAGASLRQRQVEIIEGVRAVRVADGRAELSDGSFYLFDYAFIATGVQPSSIFRASGLPVGTDGGLLVNAFLQSVAWPEIFGGGDCIAFQPRPLDKVGVYAVRQNPILFHNLLAALEGRSLRPFAPQRHYLLIFNLGDGRGIFRRRSWVWDGRLAFRLKDRIDRRFMRRFQLSGELAEPDMDQLTP